MSKILFLDIDGVVNCKTTQQRHRGAIGIDPYMALLVARIIESTGCLPVLSSSWRHSPDGFEEVERQVYKMHDVTPRLNRARGEEIKDWLSRHSEVTKYAILDDDNDMLEEQKPNFFRTSWDTGITEEIANKVIKHLNT